MVPSYPVLLMNAIKTMMQMKSVITTLTEQKQAWDRKESAYDKIKEAWKEEARRYALNSDYWRQRSEKAEAAIVWLMRNTVSKDAKIDSAHVDAIQDALMAGVKLLED